MPRMTVSVTDRGSLGGVPGSGLSARLKQFTKDVEASRGKSARTATTVSRANVRRVRELAPARANRYHGLQDAIQWRGLKSGGVALDTAQLNAKFPPWLVQEIGTGQRAIERTGGSPNAPGRPAAGAKYVKTVRSQVGRRISPGLVWAKGGKFQRPGQGGRTGQLLPRTQAQGAPPRFDRSARMSQPGIRISREIRGQHFIQKGGQEGFREYRESVLTAARSQLKKRRT